MGVDAYSENKSHSPHTMNSRPKQDIPPRFQRANKIPGQSHHTTPQSPYIHEVSKKKEKPPSLNYLNNGEPDQLSSSSIICPLGPGQLVAAGRVQKLAADANFFLDTSSSDNKVHITGHSADVPQESELDLDEMLNMALNIEHSCEVDANLSSQLVPTMKYIQPTVPAPDYNNITANMDLLERYATARNWGKPEYITICRRPKGENAVYGTKVKIMRPNQILEYSGFPNEYENEQVSKCFAAIKALQELAAEDKVKLNQTVISTDKKLIFERICEIVGDSPAGMFAKTVEDQYLEKYLENLPKDWIELLSTCNNLSVEPSINNFIIVQRKVNPVREPQIFPEKINLEDLPEQPAVYISHMNSTCDLWARIVLDGGDAYFELITEMTHYYNNEGTKESVSEIQVGQYYAANTSMSWIRVCVTEVKHDERVVIAWLIDHGTSEIFAFGSICKLLPQYCTLPIQAVNITLDGLEYFGDDLFASEVLNNCEYIIDEVLVGVITNIDTKSENLKMILFNTSDKNDVNVNEILLDRICTKCVPQLINGCAMKVYIGSISQKGEIYIQIPGEACERIEKVINSFSPEEISKHRVTSYQQVVTNKIFLAKYQDERWYRAIVTAPPSKQQPMVNVNFIDYGNAESVNISDIAEIGTLPRIVEKLPAQALQVAMHSLPIDTLTDQEIDKLHSMLVGEEKTVLIKTVSVEVEPPVVELYYKTDNDSALVSVNNTIIVERLFESDEKKESQSPCVQNGGNGVSSGGLKCPDLDGECVPVCITLAANPGNFIFQPSTYINELESLIHNMYQYYKATTLPEVPISDVVEGQLFAALHEDSKWYRVIVTGSIDSNIFVRLCDYGDVKCVHVAKLRELTEDFKKLPFMAIKGKLAGTDPIHTDWSVEDCLRFQTLVLNKRLNSVVHFIKNVVDPMETVVELHLIDTEGEQEQNIRDILVSENRAKAKE